MIAAVEGHAVAGGLELAAWCDLRVAAEDAVFGVYCRRWGIPLMDGGTIRLARLIGHSHALDLILTGRGVSGEEALRMGLANRLVAPGETLAAAIALAHEMASRPQAALRSDRLSSYEQWSLPLDEALARRVPPRDGDAPDRRDVRRARSLRVRNRGATRPEQGSRVARTGAGISAAPTITRQKAAMRPVISTAPVPTGSRKTRMPPTIAVRLAATDVSAITWTPGPSCKPRPRHRRRPPRPPAPPPTTG